MKIPFGGTLVLCLVVLSGCQSAQWPQSMALGSWWPGNRFPHHDEPQALVDVATAKPGKSTETAVAGGPETNAQAGEIQQASYSTSDDAESPGSDGSASDAVAAAIERGNSFLRRGQLDQARDEYQKALKSDPGYVDAHHRLAVIADQKKDFAAAEFHYSQAMQKIPNDPDLLSDLGYSYLLQGRRRESETALRLALERSPGHPYASNNLKLLLNGDRKQPGAQQSPPISGTTATAPLPGDAGHSAQQSTISSEEITVIAPGAQVLKPLDAPFPGSAAESRPPAIIRGTRLSVSVTDPLTQIQNAQAAGSGLSGPSFNPPPANAHNQAMSAQSSRGQVDFPYDNPRINPGGSAAPVDPIAADVVITPRGFNNSATGVLQPPQPGQLQQHIPAGVQSAYAGQRPGTQFGSERLPTARLTPDGIPYPQSYRPQSTLENDASFGAKSNVALQNTISSMSRVGGGFSPLQRTAANPLDAMHSWPPQDGGQSGYTNSNDGLINEPGLIVPAANGSWPDSVNGQPDWSYRGGPQSNNAPPASQVQQAAATTFLPGRGPVTHADANFTVPSPPFPTDARGARAAAMVMGMYVGPGGAFLPEQGLIVPADGAVEHADAYSNADFSSGSDAAFGRVDFTLRPSDPRSAITSADQGDGQFRPAVGQAGPHAAGSASPSGSATPPGAVPSWGQQMPMQGQSDYSGRDNVANESQVPTGSSWGSAAQPSGSSWGGGNPQSFLPR